MTSQNSFRSFESCLEFSYLEISAIMLSILPLCLSLIGLVAGYADPLPCQGICNDTHDPSLIQRKSDGTYYRFATGGGIDIHTAPTIEGPWMYAGVVLPNGSSISNPGSDDAWAPDVHLVDGTYYCYYAVSSFGTQESAIGIATSKSMDPGTWTDHGSTGLSSTNGDSYNTIDPNLHQSPEGTMYMTFGSFWNDIFQTTLSADALSISGVTPYNIEYNSTGTRPSEGSYVFKQNHHFYLFWSSGICCGYDTSRPAPGDEYKIMVCRSDKITGPYVSSMPSFTKVQSSRPALIENDFRSTKMEWPVSTTAARKCSARTAWCMGLVDRACIVTTS